jgi:hypothetical protein
MEAHVKQDVAINVRDSVAAVADEIRKFETLYAEATTVDLAGPDSFDVHVEELKKALYAALSAFNAALKLSVAEAIVGMQVAEALKWLERIRTMFDAQPADLADAFEREFRTSLVRLRITAKML